MVGRVVVRACDNHVYIIATNAVRPDAGGSYYFGHSTIINPIAWRLAPARGGEEIIAARLDPDPLRHVTCDGKSPQIFHHVEDCSLALWMNPPRRGVALVCVWFAIADIDHHADFLYNGVVSVEAGVVAVRQASSGQIP